MLGRPTIKRRLEFSNKTGRHTVSKEGKKVACGICKQMGHKKATCTELERPRKSGIRKRQTVRHTQESVNVGRCGQGGVNETKGE